MGPIAHVSYEDALIDAGCPELSCAEFYRELFSYSHAYLRYGVRMELPVTYADGGDDGAGTWRSVPLSELEECVADRNDAYVSPCTFFPRRGNDGRYRSMNGARYADELCAFVLDIDDGGGQNLSFAVRDWWEASEEDAYLLMGEVNAPRPTYVVCSGGGVHLYYVLEEPVACMTRWMRELAHINNYLYDCYRAPYKEHLPVYAFYDDDTPFESEAAVFSLGKIDRHGVVQPYRAVGSRSKPKHGETLVSAWRVGETYDLSDLAAQAGLKQTIFTADDFDMDNSLFAEEVRANKERARIWRERNGGMKGRRRGWNPGFYKWLAARELDRSRLYGEYGHRYNQVVSLSVAAVKDRIGRKQLEEDVRKIYEGWNKCSLIYGHPPIRWSECCKAMKMYDRQFSRDVRKYPKWWLEEKCGFEFGTQKRNGRSQDEHLKRARRLRSLYIEDGVTDAVGGGRPKGSGTKEAIIKAYAASHPEATHSEIARALGVSRPTVIKWLKHEAE